MLGARNRVEAKVAGGALVVSFGDKLWRAEMPLLASAALELRDEKDKVILVLRRPGAAPEDLYAFGDRESAAAGLHAVTQALFVHQQAAAQQQAAQAVPVVVAPARPGLLGRALKTAFYLFLAFVCGFLLLVLSMAKPANRAAIDAARVPKVQQGVPIPADQLFGKEEGP